MCLCLDDHVGSEHHQEHYRTDHHPACLPEDVWLLPSHEIDVFTKTVGGNTDQKAVLKPTGNQILYESHKTTELFCIKEEEEEEVEKRLLFHSMDINYTNNLKECNDEQRHRAHVAVKDFHPVVPRTQGEDESCQEGHQADDG